MPTLEEIRNAKPISAKKIREVAAKYGFKPMTPDHPSYNDGPTIIFISRAPKKKN